MLNLTWDEFKALPVIVRRKTIARDIQQQALSKKLFSTGVYLGVMVGQCDVCARGAVMAAKYAWNAQEAYEARLECEYDVDPIDLAMEEAGYNAGMQTLIERYYESYFDRDHYSDNRVERLAQMWGEMADSDDGLPLKKWRDTIEG